MFNKTEFINVYDVTNDRCIYVICINSSGVIK